MKRLLTILIFTTSTSYGQSEVIAPDTVITAVQIILTNGKKIEGTILAKSREFLLVRTTKSDTIQIEPKKILGIVPIQSNEANKEFPEFETQFGFKYFLFNTAIPVGEKKWFYSNQYLIISNFNYGITKKLSAGISFFTFNPTTLFSPKLKFTFNPEAKVKLAITAQYLYVQIWKSSTGYENFNYGFVQAIMTIGNKNNFTLSVGKAISKSGLDQGYVATIGLAKRISPTLSLITENNILIGTDRHFTLGLLSAGLRLDRKKHSFDFGVFAFAIVDRLDVFTRPLPFISYNLKLSR